MYFLNRNLPLILSVILYLLLFWLRFLQGGWEIKTDLFQNQRQALDETITKFLPSPQAQLLSGIVLGEKKSLPPKFQLALRDTSTLHIVVVSGQNLSMVAGFFLALAGLIKRKAAIILAFGAIIFYTLLTGAQVPVLRATIMVSLSFLAQIFGRQNSGFWTLVVTGAFMLLLNPQWLFDLSFQLSFMATMGLIIIAPILLKYFKYLPLIGQDLAITMGAQIAVMPIIIQHFHQLSLVAVITNLLVGWTVPFIMIGGAVMLILGSISQILGTVVALILNILLTYFVYIVQFIASMPFAWEYVGEQIWVVWVGYYMVLGGVLLMLTQNANRKTQN
ncbi:ComEC/Rec2 family competence protein [Candidatus Daviesbacteria bacterium]|nr:ComEC/Rec2 family competence protein [Candidatus Daviesbacteria bacterium]